MLVRGRSWMAAVWRQKTMRFLGLKLGTRLLSPNWPSRTLQDDKPLRSRHLRQSACHRQDRNLVTNPLCMWCVVVGRSGERWEE
jgi:hypothetical protein